jgi:hypothetical protein
MTSEELQRIVIFDSFKVLLGAHDWSFEMSDDPGAWERGRETKRAIAGLARKMLAMGIEREDIEYLVNQRICDYEKVEIYVPTL